MRGHPFGAVLVLLALPDGYHLFQCVDDVLAGGEAFGAVRRGHGHYHGHVAQRQGAFAQNPDEGLPTLQS